MLPCMNWQTRARRQGGVLARSQLLDDGYSPASVDQMLRSGRLCRTTSDGVYRAPGAPHSAETACWMAALGARSPLSYLTAAEVWEMPVPTDGWVHITRLDRKRLDWPTGVRVHRVALDPTAVTTRHGLPVTNRHETVLDCLGWMELSAARTFADRAAQQLWLAPAHITARLENQPGRWGNRRLQQLLPMISDRAESEAERRFHKLLRGADITGWNANFRVGVAGKTYRIDVAFPEARIAIEIDGFAYHSSQGAFQSDRQRDAALAAAGWRVVRFTWLDLTNDPAGVIARIRALLAL
jgi:very-short-patch-repair endonuclease